MGNTYISMADSCLCMIKAYILSLAMNIFLEVKNSNHSFLNKEISQPNQNDHCLSPVLPSKDGILRKRQLRKFHNSNNLITVFSGYYHHIPGKRKKWFLLTFHPVVQIIREMYTQGSKSNKINIFTV